MAVYMIGQQKTEYNNKGDDAMEKAAQKAYDLINR